MACMINNHVVTVNGVAVVNPVAGSDCDCGKTVVQYLASGAMVMQYTPTGRLVGR